MKSKSIIRLLLGTAAAFVLSQCDKPSSDAAAGESGDSAPVAGQSAVADDVSQKDIVKVAVGSPAHTTLVAAVKAAELVDVLSNAGPFTVFAPTNEAFDKLPKGTVEDLLKPENKDKLADILQYHVLIGGYPEERFTDGSTIGTASGGSVKISVKDGKVIINDSATIIGTVDRLERTRPCRGRRSVCRRSNLKSQITAMLVSRHLTKSFGRLRALDDVGVSMERGQSVLLIGPNGSGKTTFIKCVLGLVIPDKGELTLDGAVPVRKPGAAPQHRLHAADRAFPGSPARSARSSR